MMGITELLVHLDRAGYGVAKFLLGALWQSTILFAAVALLAWALRRRRAGLRHALWVGAILAAPLIPALTWGLAGSGAPRAEVAVFPSYAAVDMGPATFEALETPAIDYSSESVPPATATEDPAAPLRPWDYPWALLTVGYVTGAAVFLIWVAVGWLQITLWRKKATSVRGDRAVAAFGRAARRFGVRRRFKVLESDGIRAPFTVGALSPAVMLPRGWSEGLSDRDLEALALHETAHVKRRDPFLFLLVALVRAVLFFHPLVWFAARRVSLFAEQAADDAVLDATGAPFSYAKALSRIARSIRHRSLSVEIASGIVLTRSAFLQRIEAILSDRRDRIRKLSLVALAALIAASGLSLVLALALPLGEKGAEPTSATVSASDEEETSAEVGLDHFLGRYADARREGTPLFQITKKGDTYVHREFGGPTHEMEITERGLQFFDPAERFVVRYSATDGYYYLDVGPKNQTEPYGSLRLLKLASDAPAPTVSGGRRLRTGDMVWITLLPASPIVSIEDFQCTWTMRPTLKGGLEAVDAEIEIRTADNSRQVVAGVRLTGATFDKRQLRLIGELPDGDYLLAVTVDGVRASNVAPLKIDSSFDFRTEPVLKLVPLPLAPGRELPYVGLVATGRDPIDLALTNLAASRPTLVVDGVERRVTQITVVGMPVAPLKPGKRRLTIVDLSPYEPAIAPGGHTVSAKVLTYQSAPVTIPADDSLERAWDAATPSVARTAPAAALLSGRVVRPDGKAAAGYEVGISGEKGRFRETCDDTGRYGFVNVPAGSFP
ncbi:MAG: M56 family metallopeptidase [Planctomycetota bacterium]|jgi:beta-lactamase regulating signal transducer with metallopeptidase domain